MGHLEAKSCSASYGGNLHPNGKRGLIWRRIRQVLLALFVGIPLLAFATCCGGILLEDNTPTWQGRRLAEWLERTHDEDASVRLEAVNCLAEITRHAASGGPMNCGFGYTGRVGRQYGAFKDEVERLRPQVVSAIDSAADDPAPRIRANVISNVYCHREVTGIERRNDLLRIVQAYNDPDLHVRRQIRESILLMSEQLKSGYISKDDLPRELVFVMVDAMDDGESSIQRASAVLGILGPVARDALPRLNQIDLKPLKHPRHTMRAVYWATNPRLPILDRERHDRSPATNSIGDAASRAYPR